MSCELLSHSNTDLRTQESVKNAKRTGSSYKQAEIQLTLVMDFSQDVEA